MKIRPLEKDSWLMRVDLMKWVTIIALLAAVLLLVSGCSSPGEPGSLERIHKDGRQECRSRTWKDCMAEQRAIDDECGPFCEVLVGGYQDESLCDVISRKVCQ